ncbi:AMP-binding protein [Myxococcota bacterium]|nr:AMP-binding protein [Myxococcota bacterium]
MRIAAPLTSAARSRPEHPLLEFEGASFTAAALHAEARRLAGGLAAAGVGPGDVVALLGDPEPSFVAHLHAAWWLGAVVAPVAPRAAESERDALLRRLDPRWIVHPKGVALPDGDPPPERLWGLDEPALRLASSGSTGAPKLLSITMGQLLFSALGSAARLGHLPDDRWLCCLPLNHVGGLSVLTRSAILGFTALLHPRFDAARVAQTLDAGEVSLVSLVPAMLSEVLDQRPERPFPPRLRVILLGGAPCPAPLRERVRALGLPVSLTWGMTETASQVATRAPGDLRPGADVGWPLPFNEVVADADGVLTVRGPLAPEGEHRTNDRGRLDDAGRVIVSGRADLVLISGGENIQPAELEAALLEHPEVTEAAVIGRADPRWGERPVAFVTLRPDATVTGEALRAWCRQRLSAFKVPDRVIVLDALPRTALGKVDRGALSRL